MYTGLEGNVMCFWLTLLEALRSYEAFRGRPILRVWEKTLYALPECIQVIIIHYLITWRESVITTLIDQWRLVHKLKFKLVMTQLHHCTTGIYFVLDSDTDVNEDSRLFREDIWWSVCINYVDCEEPHKLKRQKIRHAWDCK